MGKKTDQHRFVASMDHAQMVLGEMPKPAVSYLFATLLPPEGLPAELSHEGLYLVWSDEGCELAVEFPPNASWDRCLDAFIRLHDASETPDRVRRFARRYGGLELCEHSRSDGFSDASGATWAPAESVPALPWYTPGECPSCMPAESEHREPISVWVWCARQLRAALRIAAYARTPKEARTLRLRPSQSDFDALGLDLDPGRLDLIGELLRLSWDLYGDEERFWNASGPALGPWSDTEAQWLAVVHIADQWLRQPDAINVEIDHGRVGNYAASLTIHATNLRGLLALQLVGALTSQQGVYTCDRCLEPYTIPPGGHAPWRNNGRKAFCSQCAPEAKRERERQRYRGQYPTVRRRSAYQADPNPLPCPEIK